jgi:hypothetical protein
MDTGAAYLLGAGLLGLFGVLGYHAWQTRGAHRRLSANAAARGWTFSAGTAPVVYTLSGQLDGIAFSVESRRPAGLVGQNRGTAPTVTTVTLAAARIDGTVAATPVVPDAPGVALATALTGDLFARILLGQEAAVVNGLPDQTGAFAGGFPTSHRVFATDGDLARRVFGPELCDSLDAMGRSLGPTRPVVVIRTATQASVRVLDTVTDLDRIADLVRLAALVARGP